MLKTSRWQQQKRHAAEQPLMSQLLKELGLTLISGFLVASVSNFILQVFQNQFSTELAFKFIFEWHTELFLLGTSVLLILYLWLVSLIGSRRIGALALLVLALGMGIATQQKMAFREEPMYPSDFAMVTNLPFLLKMMDARVLWLSVAGIGILLVGGYSLIKYFRKRNKTTGCQRKSLNKGLRAGLLVLSSMALVYINAFNDPGNRVKAAYNDYAYWIPYSQEMNYYNNGFVGGFLYNLNVSPMEKPVGYSKKRIEQLVEKYEKQAQTINKTRTAVLDDVNIIYVMNESFSDPTALAHVGVSQDPIPKIRTLMEQHTSGNMLSQGYGGGTANIEFEALTGLSMEPFVSNLSTPYTQMPSRLNQVPSVVSYLQQLGHATTAIHPYNTSMYKRKQVYEEMGFDTFIHEGTMTYDDKLENNPYISDYAAYQEILAKLQETDRADFVHLVTMQNHMPYATNYPSTAFKGSHTADDSEAANYYQGLAYSDDALKNFLDQLQDLAEDTIVVFWGDHLPGFYGDEVVAANDELTMHQTPVLIASTKKSENETLDTISPIYFMNHVLKAAGAPVTPYYALLMELEDVLPAFEKGIYLEKGSQTAKQSREELTAPTLEILQDYDLLQYDTTVGENYSKTAHFYSE
ncbi:MAG: LTA synthase family protein [Carnobacterium sp.]|uniref:LTA synthase family protein n=1 Tax=Carnobacterium sp. TaxID=48221 RepID=UPI002FCA7746